MKKVIKKISAIAMAFTLLGTGTVVENFLISKSRNRFTANAAYIAPKKWTREKIKDGPNKGRYIESAAGVIYVNGDVTRDGKITIEDACFLINYINGIIPTNSRDYCKCIDFKAPADVNWDHKIDIQDAVMILNHINGIKALP